MDKTLIAEIKEYLAQDQMEFFAGLELYTKSPKAKQNLVLSFNQNWNKGTIHKRLIYELEKMIEVKEYSGRSTVLEQRPANIPYKMIDDTKQVAPQNFEYKIPYDSLPEELKALVIEKGQLYNSLDIKKKSLASVGEVNDQKSISTRRRILKSMEETSDRIIKIHALLLEFNDTEEMKPEVFDKLKDEEKEKAQAKLDNFIAHANTFKNKPVCGVKSDEKAETETSEEVDQDKDELDELYNYKAMGYFERKEFLARLRSSVPKQEKKANESEKPEIAEKNRLKAESGRKMIALLEKYFEETPKPEK